MDIAAQILVVILSVFLAIFLILGIVLVIYLISLTRQIRKITLSAGNAVESVGSVISKFSKYISPVFIAEVFSKVFDKVKKDKSNKKHQKDEEA